MFDQQGKDAVRGWLEGKGISLDKDVEDFKADIKCTIKEHHEVEIKAGWSGEWKSHWHTLHIPVRKKSLLGLSDRLIFWVLNNDCSRAVIVNGLNLKDKFIKNIPNRRSPDGEDFFDIPIKYCNHITLKEDA
tara:strand:+ start:196 stop:591 length:396 start_codon:yes stop_codon:yes gene_type:complete